MIEAVESRMRHVLDVIAREKLAPVAIYGAGAHTPKVIRALLESPVPIAGFVDASREKIATGVCGWRVVAPEQVDRLGARSVVINTDRYESRIWAERGELERHGLRVFRLYSGEAGCEVGEGRGGGNWEKLTRPAVQEYWRSRGSSLDVFKRAPERGNGPVDRYGDNSLENAPESYLAHLGWSVIAAEWLESTGMMQEAPIVELGSNIGRNLAYFRRRGFSRLTGIELNPAAVSLMGAFFPETSAAARVHVGSFEEILPACADGEFEASVTMAALMCVHSSSEAIFSHVSRVTRRWLLTIEDETNDGARYFPRDYSNVFGRLGWHEVRALAYRDVGVESRNLLGLQAGYVMRLMTKV